MPVVVHTGSRVAPGDVLFTSAAAVGPLTDDVVAESEVLPGEGCLLQFVEEPSDLSGSPLHGAKASTIQRCIVATRQGVAQWDGHLVSIFAAPTTATAVTTPRLQQSASHAAEPSEGPVGASVSATSSRVSVIGPRPGDTVHLRVTRLNRLFAFGEIIAVNWRWCSHRSSAAVGASGVFKGVLRVEDIRPFRPVKNQLQPPAPTLAFALGDVVLAEVISQSDAQQYQLSTMGEGFGVVESYVSSPEEHYGGREKIKLRHIPGRRDAMMAPSTGSVVSRWCPLLP